MTLSRKLNLLLGSTFSLIIVFIIILQWSHERLDFQQKRTVHSFSELVQFQKIALEVQRQVKEVGDSVLLGEKQMEEYLYSKETVFASFDELGKWVEKKKQYEFAAVEDELNSIADLKLEYLVLLKEIQKVFALNREGNLDETIDYIENVLEQDFDNNFIPHINKLIEEEKSEIKGIRKEAENLSKLITTVSFLLIGISLVFCFFIIFSTRNFIFKPIKILADGARKIGKGALDVEIEIKSKDGLGLLAHSFNMMTHDLKDSREKLILSRDYVENIIETMTDMLVVVTPGGTILNVNQATCAMLGYREDELIGREISFLFAEDALSVPHYQNFYKALIDKKASLSLELMLISNDGQRIPVLFSGKVMRDTESKIQGIVYVMTNITEFRRAQTEKEKLLQDLKEREKMTRSVVENIQDSLVVMDETGIIKIFNSSAEKNFNYSTSEIIGQSIKTLMPESYHKAHDEGVKRYLRTGESKIFGTVVEVEGKRKDGTNFPIELAITDIRLKKERLFVGTMRDLTARKKTEEQMKEAQILLARTEKLSSIGTLAAGVSHEILNPLNIINVIAQIELKKDNSPETRERWEIIMAQIGRATKITNTLKEFSRLGVNKNSLLNINQVFDKTASLLEHDLNTENITIERYFDEDLPEINADEDKLAQVFLNLLNNAKDAMQEGADNKIIVKAKLLSGDRIEFRFSDTGSGIPDENIEKIFDPFFTTKEPGKGTGLGLSIIHEIVENLGGSLSAKNGNDGEGAVFTIQLPLWNIQKENNATQ